MQRFLPIVGVCVLLLAVQTEASKDNKKSFWDLWGSDSGKVAPAAGSDDFTLDTEGSGFDDTDIKVDNTHADDEDFDVGSGDGEYDTDSIDLTTDVPDTGDKDEYYYDNKATDNKGTDNKGTSDDEDDDDDYLEGSGSGVGIEETIVPVNVKPVEGMVDKTTTRKPLTACENLRNTAQQAKSAFMPECERDGSFEKRQCMVDIRNKEKNCWCVDPHGIEVSGTKMKHPKSPDCNFGEGMSTCVFQLVQHSQGLLGAYKPKCTLEGDYEQIQCQGSECWCVDAVGNEITGTMTNKPKIPNCPSPSTPKTVGKPIITDKTKPLPETEEPGYTIPEDSSEDITNVIVNIGPEIPIDSEEIDLESGEEETNSIGEPYATMRHNEPILAQPGLLAAIIGGAVVGLLCMVLLVMFVVYRMRKKDEGSYPLDEQKYQNYSYAKAPDKEFYA